MRRCVWSRNLKNEEALAHWGLLRQKQTNKHNRWGAKVTKLLATDFFFHPPIPSFQINAFPSAAYLQWMCKIERHRLNAMLNTPLSSHESQKVNVGRMPGGTHCCIAAHRLRNGATGCEHFSVFFSTQRKAESVTKRRVIYFPCYVMARLTSQAIIVSVTSNGKFLQLFW